MKGMIILVLYLHEMDYSCPHRLMGDADGGYTDVDAKMIARVYSAENGNTTKENMNIER